MDSTTLVTTAFATIALDPFLDFNRQSQIFGLQRFTVQHTGTCRRTSFFVVVTNSWKIRHLQLTHYFNISISSQHFGQQQIPTLASWGWKWMRVVEAGVLFGSLNV